MLPPFIRVKAGKGGTDSVTSYQPISLPFLPSKLLEHIVHNHPTMHYLLSNNLLSSHQFDFHPGSSTQEALLYATDDWHIHLNKDYLVTSVFIDLSKAFDRVSSLQVDYVLCNFDISGSLLKRFQNYLSGRRQRAVLNGQFSSTCLVTSGYSSKFHPWSSTLHNVYE